MICIMCGNEMDDNYPDHIKAFTCDNCGYYIGIHDEDEDDYWD